MMVQTEIEATARSLVGVYFQTSRAYRTVVRFPEGRDPIELLTEAAMRSRPWDAEEWARRLGRRSAGDHWLRVYAPRECKLELTVAMFRAYLDAGGTTYDGRRTP